MVTIASDLLTHIQLLFNRGNDLTNPTKQEIKDTTKSNTSSSLDSLLSIDRGSQLCFYLYDKYDDFNFHITNVPFLKAWFINK